MQIVDQLRQQVDHMNAEITHPHSECDFLRGQLRAEHGED